MRGTEHAQCLCGQRGVLRGDFGAIRVRERTDAIGGEDLRAVLQQQIGRAIDEGAVTAIGHQTDDGLAFAVGIEGNLMPLWHLAFDQLLGDACLVSGGKHRAFGGIADDFPLATFEREMRVVAAEEVVRGFAQGFRLAFIGGFARNAHFAIRPVSFASDLKGLSGDVKHAHGHFADGERAGLVGADNIRRSQRFDRRQPAHQRTAA